MTTPITRESLIDAGFHYDEYENFYWRSLWDHDDRTLCVMVTLGNRNAGVYLARTGLTFECENAETIEDLNELHRLFFWHR